MSWRVEWTGGTANGMQPRGWARLDGRVEVVEIASRLLAADARLDIRIVLVERADDGDFDVVASRPDLTTLALWPEGAMLPAASPYAPETLSRSAAVRRQMASDRLRRILDQLLEDGDLTRYEASGMLASLETAILRSAASTAA